MMLAICISCLFLLFFLCCFFAYKLYQFSIIIIETESAIEDSLDILNERYESISKILQKEIFFDSVEVRQVVDDIKLSQDAIYVVALKLLGDKGIDETKKDEKE